LLRSAIVPHCLHSNSDDDDSVAVLSIFHLHQKISPTDS
jgi:hypothetical protein